MKKAIIVILLSSICLAAFSCAQPGSSREETPEATGTVLTGISTAGDTSEGLQRPSSPEDGLHDGKHIGAFWDVSFAQYLVDSYQLKQYRELFSDSKMMTLGGIIDYYGIPIEDYERILSEQIENDPTFDKNPANYAALNYKVWYSNEWENDDSFIWDQYNKNDVPESVTVIPEDPADFINAYFTVDGALIRHVGEEKFADFKSKYGNTADYNIIRFIKEFAIDKSAYLGLYNSAEREGVADYYSCPVPADTLFESINNEALFLKCFQRRPAHRFDSFTVQQGLGSFDDYFCPDGKHVSGFCQRTNDREFELVKALTGSEKEAADFCGVYMDTLGFNPGGIIDHYGLTREEYIKAVDAFCDSFRREGKPDGDFVTTKEAFMDQYPFIYDYELWADPLYFDREELIKDDYSPSGVNTVFNNQPEDTVHTNTYFTIDNALIEYVKAESLSEFERLYAGTPDYNILKFIEYFGISRMEMLNLYNSRYPFSFGPYPYNIDMLYGSKAAQDQYLMRKQL